MSKCLGCGTEVPDYYDNCPACGKDTFRSNSGSMFSGAQSNLDLIDTVDKIDSEKSTEHGVIDQEGVSGTEGKDNVGEYDNVRNPLARRHFGVFILLSFLALPFGTPFFYLRRYCLGSIVLLLFMGLYIGGTYLETDEELKFTYTFLEYYLVIQMIVLPPTVFFLFFAKKAFYSRDFSFIAKPSDMAAPPLALFFGFVGAHKAYLGQWKMALLFISIFLFLPSWCTFVIVIISFIDFVNLCEI